MHTTKDRYAGEDFVQYESKQELEKARENYKAGNYASLTCKEIALFRECDEDPDNRRWEHEHAGCFADNVSQWDLDELVFVYDLGKTLEEGRQILLEMIGPHPITILTIYELDRELAAKVCFNH